MPGGTGWKTGVPGGLTLSEVVTPPVTGGERGSRNGETDPYQLKEKGVPEGRGWRDTTSGTRGVKRGYLREGRGRRKGLRVWTQYTHETDDKGRG